MVHVKMFFSENAEIFPLLVSLIKKGFTSLALGQDKQIFFYSVCGSIYYILLIVCNYRISVSRLILMITSLQQGSLFCYLLIFLKQHLCYITKSYVLNSCIAS